MTERKPFECTRVVWAKESLRGMVGGLVDLPCFVFSIVASRESHVQHLLNQCFQLLFDSRVTVAGNGASRLA
jgi:hypothetical protein